MNEVEERGDFKLKLWISKEGVNLTNDDVAKIAAHGKKIWKIPSKAAIVVPDDLSFGIMRVHDVYREKEGHENHVFRKEQEALSWLKESRE